MNTWKVILATLVIFGTGVITGGMLVNYSDHFQNHLQKHAVVETPKRTGTNAVAGRFARPALGANLLRAKDFLARLDRELKLSVEQRDHIEKIIIEGQENFKNICQEELADTREKILDELTPEQQTLFTELLKRRPVPPHPATNSVSSTGMTNFFTPAKKP